jgi:transcriptional regulator with XRE-family HTH domain
MDVTRQPLEPPEDRADTGPTIARLRLGAYLRKLREAKGVTRQQAGRAIRGSESKISRLELGRHGIKERDLVDLLALYEVTDAAEREVALEWARHGNQTGWWQPYSDIAPTWQITYLGLEQAASVIRSYHAQVLPELLQTEDYARAVAQVRHLGVDQTLMKYLVELQLARQHILHRPGPPRLWTVVDEAALRRVIGDPAVMRDQLEQLLRLSELPHIRLQVLTFTAGGHPAIAGSFTMLRFPGDLVPDVIYLEQLTTASFPDRDSDHHRYLHVMNRLGTLALEPEESRAMIRRILHEAAVL